MLIAYRVQVKFEFEKVSEIHFMCIIQAHNLQNEQSTYENGISGLS